MTIEELLKQVDEAQDSGNFWQTCSHESSLSHEQPCGELVRLARLGAAVVEDYAGWGDSTSWDIADFGKHVQQIVREHGYE